MSTVVYSVSPDAPLDKVVVTMAEHKYGSAVVMQNEKVVGIFTSVDVCRAFAELLHTRVSPTDRTTAVKSHRERHLGDRGGWLRAAILGADDGVVSTGS